MLLRRWGHPDYDRWHRWVRASRSGGVDTVPAEPVLANYAA